jgi:hypothetical protein
MINMEFEEKYEFALKKLNAFKNFIEISDFRSFLLLALNLDSGNGPEAIMKKLGLGSKNKLILPFDPEKKLYFTKIMLGLNFGQQITVFQKSDKISEDFVNKADSKLFTENLSTYEREHLIPKNFIVISPEILDFSKKSLEGENVPKVFVAGIESLYVSLAEFIASQTLKFLFLIEGKDDEADIVFSLNAPFDPKDSAPNQIQYFDVFVDEEKKLRGQTYIRMKKDELDLQFMKEVNEMTHSELFNSHFTVIIPIKSFDELNI